MSRYEERLKKLQAKYGTGVGPEKAMQSKTAGESRYEKRLSELKSKYAVGANVDDNFINTFITDADNYLKSAESAAKGIGYSTAVSARDNGLFGDNVRDLSARAGAIRSYLKQNRGNYTKEGYESLLSTVENYSTALRAYNNYFYDSAKYYSQWATEEEYNNALSGWLNPDADTNETTVALRKEKYNSNAKRAEEIEAALPWYAKTFLPSSVEKIFLSKEKDALLDELDAIKTENNQYRRTQGVLDDYYVPVTEEFAKNAAYRDYSNASRDELWAYDVTEMQGVQALNNGGSFDDDGNILDSKGNIVHYANGPVVEDKLGLFLSATDADITEAYNLLLATNGNYTNTWANYMQEGDVNGWKYLKPNEVDIYYDLLKREGQEAAYEFLTKMTPTLTKRETQKTTEWIKSQDGLAQLGLNAASIPMNVFGGAVSFVDDAINILQGEEINPYSRAHSFQTAASDIRTKTATDINSMTGNASLPLLGYTWGDVYQSVMSAGDSALGVAIGSGAYGALMGMGAASAEMKDLYDKGASMGQIAAGGVLAGAAEMVFEKYSIDKLVSMGDSKSIKAVIVNLLKQGGIEATEEMATEIANTITNVIVMGSQSDWVDAKTFAKNVVNAGLSGFISGGLSGGVGATANFAMYNHAATKYGQKIIDKGDVAELQDLAMEMAGVKDGINAKAIGNLSKKVSSDATANRVGRLADLMVDTTKAQNKADIQTALESKGLSKKDAARVADYLYGATQGEMLTEEQAKEAENDDRIAQVYGALIGKSDSPVYTRSKKLAHAINKESASFVADAEGISTTDAKTAPKIHYEVSENGKMTNTETGETIDPQGLVQAADGTYMIANKDGDPVASGNVSYADKNQAMVYETFVNLEPRYGKTSRVVADMDLASRNELLGLYNPEINKDGGRFVNGILDAFFYGHRSVDLSAASKDSPIWELTEQQRKIAWNTGRTAGIKAVTVAQSNVDAVYAEAKKILEEGKAKKGTFHAILEEDVHPNDLNRKQRAVYNIADDIAQGIQTNIRVYRGKNKAQGFYNHATDEIWLNLNAADTNREAIMAFTLAHEIVHRSKKGSPAQYQAFVDFLMKEYGKQGADVEAMIAEQLQAVKDFNASVPDGQKISMTREKALEEVVCDACQRMLLDTNAGQKLAEFGAQSRENKGFLEDLKRWISELMDKLRRYFRNAEPDSLAAKAFNKFDENVKQMLADMYVDMAVDAGEKLSTIKAAVKKNQEEKRFSLPKGDTVTDSFNHMAKVISGIKQDRMYADSVVSTLRGKGVKDEDIGRSGIEVWLEEKTYVTKDELMRLAESCFDEADVVEKVYDIRWNKAQRYKDLVEIGEMPNLYSELFGLTGKVYVSWEHLYQNMVSKREAETEGRHIKRKEGKIDYHELGETKVISAIMWFQNPIAIMESLNDFKEPRLVSILDEKGNDGNNLFAVLEIYTNKTAYGVPQERNHVLITIYEKSSLPDYVKATADVDRILYIRKGASMDTEASLQLAGAISKETLKKNLAQFVKKIKTFREKNHIDYKFPVGEDASPRSLLANAFEGITTNDIEKQKLIEYRDKVEMLNAEEQKLRKLRAEIKNLSFAKGKRDTARISSLQDEATKTANRISNLDKILLRLEAAAPLQNILKREKEMAYKRAEQKGKETLKAYREAERKRDEEWHSQVKDKYQASKKKAIETREKREAREKLQKLVLETVKWVTYPAKTDVKCPDILKQPYKDFLDGIDLSSKRLASGGDPTKNDLRLANAMGSLATALDKIMISQDPASEVDRVLDTGYLDLPVNFVQQLRQLTEDIKSKMVEGEYVINTMTSEEVRKLSQMIRTLNHSIKTMSKLYATLRFANIEALGAETMGFVDALGEVEKTGGMKDFVQWDNALPYYAFKRFGKGGETVFEGLMDAQDKLAFLAKEIFAFRDKTWSEKEAKAWSGDTHTITLPNGNELTLTTADAMSIYCLSRREHAIPHLLGGGIRVLGIQKGSKKAKDSRSLLTIEDVNAIVSSLTDRQKQVAEGIQEFMSTVCSGWGNEISMKRFLTKEFNERFYFPIESNDENLTTKDPVAQQSDLFRLLNISATKPLTEGANNEVIIRNIFDVFSGHTSDMARLNAFGMALLDYMKWLNYREKITNDDGQITVRGVRKSMQTAYGDAAMRYVLGLIKDVNGRASDGGDPTILMKWMRAAKTASVGSSLKVATLQVTSYPRAALVLSPRSLTLGLSKLPQIDKAKKYCGIALWKSYGFYDINISRSIEDQMKGVKNVKQKLIELSLKGAEWGDAITWGCLWNACEYEVAKTTKHKVGSEEFYQEVGRKLREVVYRTQVVDSTLTRSQMMRSKRGTAQEAAAFMSEPTLSANILMDAGFAFNMEKRRTGSAKVAWDKTSAYICKAVAVYSIGQAAAALLEGLWDAWRDEEDEELLEKYVDAFVENLVLDLVPFNKIPIVSDVVDAVLAKFDVGFYSSDKMSTTWLAQASSAVDAWKEVLDGKSSITAYNALYKSVRAISSLYGVSFSGVMREGVALWNNTAGAYDITWKIRTWDLSKEELAGEALDAIIAGNDRQVNSIRGKFNDEDSYQSALRTAIKGKYTAGDIDYDTAVEYLIEYGGMDENAAFWKVEEWKYEGDTGENFAKYNEFFVAVESGKNLKTTISKYTDNGVSKETLASQITSHYKPLYKEMSNSERASIKGYLLNAYSLLGYDRSKKAKDIDRWVSE